VAEFRPRFRAPQEKPTLVSNRFRVQSWLGASLLLCCLAATAAAAPRPESWESVMDRETAGNRGQRVEPGRTEWDEVLESEEMLLDGQHRKTLPVQYPLENDFLEGNDPAGHPLDAGPRMEPDWREQTVVPGQPTEHAEVLPYADWTSTRYTIDVLPRTEDGLGFSNFEFRGTLTFPRAPFVWISPRFAWHFLNGPPTGPLDVPNQIYDGSIDTTFATATADKRWIGQFVIGPGVFSDFENTHDAFRLTGRAVAIHQWTPETQLIFGASYLGRKDVPWFPILGVIHVPNERLRYEISLPRPRVAYRYHSDGEHERWAYVAGEMGGGSWAVQRTSGAEDMLTYRDFQFLAGIEHKERGGVNWQCEAGWVFLRRLEFQSTVGDRDLTGTGILRLMVTY